MLNKIKEIRQDRKIAKQKRIKKEKEREKEEIIRLIRETDFEKWVEQENEEALKLFEEAEREREAREKPTRDFLEKEGLNKSYFDRAENIDYQEAKQYLLRNGFNWTDLKRMNNYKIFFEANSLVEYKAMKENVEIKTIKDVIEENKLIKNQAEAAIREHLRSYR